MESGRLPQWSEVKNWPARAGDAGLGPGPGRFHTPQSSSACVPPLLSLHAPEPVSVTRGATAMGSPSTAAKSGPCSKQRRARAASA